MYKIEGLNEKNETVKVFKENVSYDEFIKFCESKTQEENIKSIALVSYKNINGKIHFSVREKRFC